MDGEAAPLGGLRQRAVLAILLAHSNEVVPVERLIDDVWDEAPPETAGNVLQGYLSQLRKVLGRDTIATRGRGYAVVVAKGALDLHRFERQAAGSADELAAALALWRGPALSDLADLPGLRPIAARLDELRLAALEHRLEADLGRGRHGEVAAELDPVIARHPFRERLRALRMLALYRDGRQAEALEEFRAVRALLVEQLGIEPGTELHRLEGAILRQDPGLAPDAERPSAYPTFSRRCGGWSPSPLRRRRFRFSPRWASRWPRPPTASSCSPRRSRSRSLRGARGGSATAASRGRSARRARRHRTRRRLHVAHAGRRPGAAGPRAGR